MLFSVPYGKTKMTFDAPEKNVYVAFPKESPEVLTDLEGATREVLAFPDSSQKLSQAVRPGQKVVIIVDDHTRPTPTAKMIGPVMTEMLEAGVNIKDVQVIIGCGLHRPCTIEEMERIIGPELFKKLCVSNHDAYRGPLNDLGHSRHGTPMRINSKVVNADIRICLGLIEPHRLTGWTGGRKSICPGVSASETILTNHALSGRCNCEIGVLEGNIIHEDMIEIAGKVGIDFIVNAVLNEKMEPVSIVAGDWIKAHHRGIQKAENFLKIDVPFQPDILIISPGGYPRDSALWGVHGKAFTRSNILRHGGVVIMVAECRDRFGHKKLEEWMLMEGGPKAILEKVKSEPFSFYSDKAAYLARLPERCDVIFVSSGITKELIPKFPYLYAKDAQEALELAWEKVGKDSKIVLIPSAAATIPRLKMN